MAKLRVTLPAHAVVSSDDLIYLLDILQTTVEVSPVEGKESEEVAPAPAPAPVARKKAAKKKAAKKKAVKKSAPPQEETASQAETPEEPAATLSIDRGALLEQFTALVERDYDAALNLLDSFGASRFSEITDDQLPAFAQALADSK